MILSSPNKLKRGYLREDGMIFFGYRKGCKNDEYWVTAIKFDYLKKRDRACRKLKGKIWEQKNPDKVKAYFREYEKNRRKNDAFFSFKKRVRSAMCRIFTNKGLGKNTNTQEIVGCTWEILKNHIESQFSEGMTWDNRNLWHIDHIYPLASAKSEEEVTKLNHYKNLRPLWAKENLTKGSRLPFEIKTT